MKTIQPKLNKQGCLSERKCWSCSGLTSIWIARLACAMFKPTSKPGMRANRGEQRAFYQSLLPFLPQIHFAVVDAMGKEKSIAKQWYDDADRDAKFPDWEFQIFAAHSAGYFRHKSVWKSTATFAWVRLYVFYFIVLIVSYRVIILPYLLLFYHRF